jgi:hypothetical protein
MFAKSLQLINQIQEPLKGDTQYTIQMCCLSATIAGADYLLTQNKIIRYYSTLT